MLFVSYSFQFFDSSWGLLFLYTSDGLLCFHVILHHVSILTIRAIFDWIFLFPFLSWFMFCVSRRPCSPRCQTPSIQFIGKPSIIPNVFSSVQPYICRHIIHATCLVDPLVLQLKDDAHVFSFCHLWTAKLERKFRIFDFSS